MLSRGSENIFTSKQTRALSTLDKLDEAYYLYAYDIREEVSHPQLQESGTNTQIPVRQQIRKTSKSNRQFQTRRNVQRNNKFLASKWKTSTGEMGQLTKLQQTPTKKTEAFIINRAAEYHPRSCNYVHVFSEEDAENSCMQFIIWFMASCKARLTTLTYCQMKVKHRGSALSIFHIFSLSVPPRGRHCHQLQESGKILLGQRIRMDRESKQEFPDIKFNSHRARAQLDKKDCAIIWQMNLPLIAYSME